MQLTITYNRLNYNDSTTIESVYLNTQPASNFTELYYSKKLTSYLDTNRNFAKTLIYKDNALLFPFVLYNFKYEYFLSSNSVLNLFISIDNSIWQKYYIKMNKAYEYGNLELQNTTFYLIDYINITNLIKRLEKFKVDVVVQNGSVFSQNLNDSLKFSLEYRVIDYQNYANCTNECIYLGIFVQRFT